MFFFFFQAEDGIRVRDVTGVQTCALPISPRPSLAQQVPGPAVRRFPVVSEPVRQLRIAVAGRSVATAARRSADARKPLAICSIAPDSSPRRSWLFSTPHQPLPLSARGLAQARLAPDRALLRWVVRRVGPGPVARRFSVAPHVAVGRCAVRSDAAHDCAWWLGPVVLQD